MGKKQKISALQAMLQSDNIEYSSLEEKTVLEKEVVIGKNNSKEEKLENEKPKFVESDSTSFKIEDFINSSKIGGEVNLANAIFSQTYYDTTAHCVISRKVHDHLKSIKKQYSRISYSHLVMVGTSLFLDDFYSIPESERKSNNKISAVIVDIRKTDAMISAEEINHIQMETALSKKVSQIAKDYKLSNRSIYNWIVLKYLK